MAGMYQVAIVAHSWVRWLVLIAGLVALARGISGMKSRRSWKSTDDRGTLFFTIGLDVQTLLGLLIYASIGSGTRRVMEHVGGMAVALVLAHVGRVRIRRTPTSDDRHRLAVLFVGLSLLVILLSIPWSAALFRS